MHTLRSAAIAEVPARLVGDLCRRVEVVSALTCGFEIDDALRETYNNGTNEVVSDRVTTEQVALRQCLQLTALFFAVVDHALGCDPFGEILVEVILPIDGKDEIRLDLLQLIIAFPVRLEV